VKDQPAVDVLAALPVAPDEYVVEVVTGVTAHAAELDEAITRYARNWDLDRMPALDRAILRLAAYELGHRPDVPRNVVINEAVELAKVFSTEESGKFVNGMLSAMAPDLRPEAGR
jgi:N utilization substance protein B